MANAGKGTKTNGSQFFITSCPCPWLDGVHTVFAKVFKGSEVVLDLQNVKVDEFEKPLMDIRVLKINLL